MSDGLGTITHDEGTHTATCSKCPKTFSSTREGVAAKLLGLHHQEEHS